MAGNQNDVVKHGLNAVQANAETSQDKQQAAQLSSLLNGSEQENANAVVDSETDENLE